MEDYIVLGDIERLRIEMIKCLKEKLGLEKIKYGEHSKEVRNTERMLEKQIESLRSTRKELRNALQNEN